MEILGHIVSVDVREKLTSYGGILNTAYSNKINALSIVFLNVLVSKGRGGFVRGRQLTTSIKHKTIYIYAPYSFLCIVNSF